jgi:hypothetical protein
VRPDQFRSLRFASCPYRSSPLINSGSLDFDATRPPGLKDNIPTSVVSARTLAFQIGNHGEVGTMMDFVCR